MILIMPPAVFLHFRGRQPVIVLQLITIIFFIAVIVRHHIFFMLQLTKIFHFEMAHAIHGYPGACKNIHGHSYELHVSVGISNASNYFIPEPGFILDFKQIKELIKAFVISNFDHKLVLSNHFLAEHPECCNHENLVKWEVEPSVENMLIFIQRTLVPKLPAGITLAELKLYETADSYARWVNTAMVYY